MKQITYENFGNPLDVLKIRYQRIQAPRKHEVLVRMLARPINPSDLIPIHGSYAHRISLPHVPGYEGVGIVEVVGSSVSPHLVGQRVLPLRGEGTWQTYVRTSASLAIPVPDSVDDVTAAQLYINPLTAYIVCSEVLNLRPGDRLVVNACGSSIGLVFAQLANVLGFRLIAITRNQNDTEYLQRLGASHVVDTSTDSLDSSVMEITNGQGTDAAVDSIGGSDGEALAFCVKPGGRFLSIGLLSGVPVDWRRIVEQSNVRASLFHLRHWNKNVSVERWQVTFRQLIRLVCEQRLQVMPVRAAYELSDVKKAIVASESSGMAKGKVMLLGG